MIDLHINSGQRVLCLTLTIDSVSGCRMGSCRMGSSSLCFLLSLITVLAVSDANITPRDRYFIFTGEVELQCPLLVCLMEKFTFLTLDPINV